jgi:hypothetical protein
MPQANIIYFKTSGKFYTNATLELLSEELTEDGKYALMFMIVDRIKSLSQNKQLPSINSDWLKEDGFIFVTVPDFGYPCLIKPNTETEER